MSTRQLASSEVTHTLSRFFSAGFLVFSVGMPLHAQDRAPAREVLTNQTVITMVTGKLPKEVIADKIQRTAVAFDVSANGLLGLHNAQVPRQIISAMFDRVASDRALIDTLDNVAVAAMVTGKLPKEILVAKLRQTPAVFDVSAMGLVSLHSAKVPKDIITIMMHAPLGADIQRQVDLPVLEARPASGSSQTQSYRNTTDSTTAAPTSTSPSRPAERVSGPQAAKPSRTPKALLSPLPTEPGIHLVSGKSDVTLLEPNTFASGRTSNVLASAITSGMAPVKMKAVVSSAQAAIRVDDPSVEFYFAFERAGRGLGRSNLSWASLSSPNEFTLLRLDAKSDRREATTGSFSSLGSQVGTESKAVVPTTFTRIKPGLYRVTPKAPLTPGEYAFFPSSVFGPGVVSPKLFDFGVDASGNPNR